MFETYVQLIKATLLSVRQTFAVTVKTSEVEKDLPVITIQIMNVFYSCNGKNIFMR